VDQFRDFDLRDRGHSYEIGGDLDFDLGHGRMKLIGLERFNSSDMKQSSILSFVDKSPSTGSRFTTQSESGERIARAEYKWDMLGGNWQLDTEAAFNRFDQASQLYNLDTNSSFAEIQLPNSTGGVTEDRYEMILTHGRSIREGFTMQLGAGGEYSKLAQAGSGGLERTFWRPKGSLLLAWTPKKGLDLSLKLARRVGQLSFDDFLAEVFLDEGNANSGNVKLKPTQSWESDLEIKKDLGEWGSANLRLFARWYDDYVDIIPMPGGGESPGNIDNAKLYGIDWNSTFNLDPIGWKGAKLDYSIKLEKSIIDDPLTGVERHFSRHYDRVGDISLRHDIPGSNWAWGLGMEFYHVQPFFRLSEVGREYEGPIYTRAFIEHKDVFGLTMNLMIFNLTDGRGIYHRTVYTGLRNSSPVLFIENRDLSVQPIFMLNITGSF
ncbi:TonB-dependent receptor domain-containing protein, partial [Thermodesulfobacteriota bacterium]